MSAMAAQVSRCLAAQGVDDAEIWAKGWNSVSRRMKRSAQMLKPSSLTDFGRDVTMPKKRPLSCLISETCVVIASCWYDGGKFERMLRRAGISAVMGSDLIVLPDGSWSCVHAPSVEQTMSFNCVHASGSDFELLPSTARSSPEAFLQYMPWMQW